MTAQLILFLAANPDESGRLRLDREHRAIEQLRLAAPLRDNFTLQPHSALRPEDLQQILVNLTAAPYIVHFCGHGRGSGEAMAESSATRDMVYSGGSPEPPGIVLEDAQGKSAPVAGSLLAELLAEVPGTIQCVLLNACYSAEQADALLEAVPCVIGMRREIGDAAAIQFAEGFYRALFAGRDLPAAFSQGLLALKLGRHLDEALVPVLRQREAIQQRRIFLSYKQGADPDETLARDTVNVLRGQGHYVFIDKDIRVGEEWIRRIDREIAGADALLVLLSPAAAQSEMVTYEIRQADTLTRQQGRPRILPVRVQNTQPYPYPLSEILNRIHWTQWERAEDSPRLLEELLAALQGDPLPGNGGSPLPAPAAPPGQPPPPTFAAQPLRLEIPSGTMDPESRFYIERGEDRNACAAIRENGVTITIKAPRQMGKSTLLMRLIREAQKAGKTVIYMDFQLFDRALLQDADAFYRQFLRWIVEELELPDRIDALWEHPLPNNRRGTRYLTREILEVREGALLLAMDEVETVFDAPFRSDFFGMLRHWHNNRSNPTRGALWKRLDLALVTSTEPYQLIDNLNQSPFNVGEVLELPDFSEAEVAELNRRHGGALPEAPLRELYRLLHGHPYLTRRALYLLAAGKIELADLFRQAADDRGPFGDHLRHHLHRLFERRAQVEALRAILHGQAPEDPALYFRLRGAGLVKRSADGKILPRCTLYETYFRERLDGR